jgi:hypothetical protein
LCKLILPDNASLVAVLNAVVEVVVNVPGAAGITVVLGSAPTSLAVYVGLVEAFAQAETSLAGNVVGYAGNDTIPLEGL